MLRIHITTPDGHNYVHVESFQTGRPQIRRLSDGRLQIFSVQETPEIIRAGRLTHRGSRTEEVLGTYPAGSTYSTN